MAYLPKVDGYVGSNIPSSSKFSYTGPYNKSGTGMAMTFSKSGESHIRVQWFRYFIKRHTGVADGAINLRLRIYKVNQSNFSEKNVIYDAQLFRSNLPTTATMIAFNCDLNVECNAAYLFLLTWDRNDSFVMDHYFSPTTDVSSFSDDGYVIRSVDNSNRTIYADSWLNSNSLSGWTSQWPAVEFQVAKAIYNEKPMKSIVMQPAKRAAEDTKVSVTMASDPDGDPQHLYVELASDTGFINKIEQFDSVGAPDKFEHNGLPYPTGGILSGTVSVILPSKPDGVYYMRVRTKDAELYSDYSNSVELKYGNKVEVVSKPVVTSSVATRLVANVNHANGSLKVYGANNALDLNPTWEDVTEAVVSKMPFELSNRAKTASNWGIALKIILTAEDLNEVALDGFGFSFD